MADRHIHAFFDWLVEKMFYGDLDWLEDVYIYPMSVFIGDVIRVEAVSMDTAENLRARRKRARLAGVAAVGSHVRQISRKRDGRLSASVDYVFFDKDGCEIARNALRYLCRTQGDETIQVESIELLELGIPLFDEARTPRHH